MDNKKVAKSILRDNIVYFIIPVLAAFIRMIISAIGVLIRPFLSGIYPISDPQLISNIFAALIAGFCTSLVILGPSLHVKFSNDIKKNDSDVQLQSKCRNWFWINIAFGTIGFAVTWYLLVFPYFSVEPK